MKYFWINLEKAERRRNNLLRQFEDNNIEHYRVNAYLSPNDNKSSKESACIRSHIQAIFHFVLDTHDEYALICEDDLTFEFKQYWISSVEDVVKNAPSDWGVLQLATILQNIELKFADKDLYFKWKDMKTSSCLAYVIRRDCAIELLKLYLNTNVIPKADCFFGGIYPRVDEFTKYFTYTYKYPMFIYPDDNDSQLDNMLCLHEASKRQTILYLKKYTSK